MRKNHHFYRILTTVFSLLYSSFLIYAVFFAKRRRHPSGTRYLYIIPFKNTLHDFNDLPDIGLFNFLSNLLGNIFLFMPLPFILAILFKITRFSTIIFTGFLMSFTIELLQYIFDVGVADIDDLILNTLGTIFGYLCLMVCKKWVPGLFNEGNVVKNGG